MRIGSARRISGIATAMLCVAAVGLAPSPARAANPAATGLFAAACGLLLAGVGAALFIGYRRRRPVKFVA